MVRVWWLDPSLLVATHLYEADMSGVTLVSVSSGPEETVWPGDDSSCHLTLGLGNPWAEHWNLAVDPSSTLTSSSCSRLTVGATRISSLKQKNFQIIYSQHMELPLIAARLFHNYVITIVLLYYIHCGSHLWVSDTGWSFNWTVQLHSPLSDLSTSLTINSLPSSTTTILSSV